MSHPLLGTTLKFWALLAFGAFVLWVMPFCLVPLHGALVIAAMNSLFFLSGVVLLGTAQGRLRSSPVICLWRLNRRVVGFHTFKDERISVLFPEGVDERIDPSGVISLSKTYMDDLAQRFGFRLPGRLTVILLPHTADLAAILGWDVDGMALAQINVLVLSADGYSPEVVRHELVHLFAARWNLWAPLLLKEGLAVWLQGRWRGRSVEDRAGDLIASGETKFSQLLYPRNFCSGASPYSCYLLAGGFTGFLIRRFGWDRYGAFYRRAIGIRFRSRFEKHFGMTLETAWQGWCDETGTTTLSRPLDAEALATLKRRLQADSLFNPF